MNNNTGLYRTRDNLIQFYKKQEYLILPAFRFLVSLAVLFLLRSHLGVHIGEGAALNSTLLNVIIALVCSLIPTGYAAGVLALVMVWDLYGLSLEAVAICLALILICILVYFRFSPRDSMILLLMPVAYAVNLHYAVPVLAGLMFGPGAAVPVVFGLVFTRFVLLVEESLPEIGSSGGEALVTGERLISNFRGLIDGMMHDRSLIVLAIALAAALIAVWFIRLLAVNYAWIAAITVGCIVELVCLLVGEMMFSAQIDIVSVFVGIVLSFVLAQIVRYFIFNMDYLRVENVQFEDEDYYYYVKAVPKMMFPLTDEEAEDAFAPSEEDF